MTLVFDGTSEVAKIHTSGRQKDVEEDDFVTLTRTDRSGMARPVPESKHPTETWGGKRRKKQKVLSLRSIVK